MNRDDFIGYVIVPAGPGLPDKVLAAKDNMIAFVNLRDQPFTTMVVRPTVHSAHRYAQDIGLDFKTYDVRAIQELIT